MIAAEEFDAYNRAAAQLAGEAERTTRQAISRYVRENPSASVAEIREFARALMAGMAQTYGDAASSLAAEWYDERGQGKGLERAVIEQTYSPEQVEKVARYQARKLEQGAYGRFAQSCGEYAANHVRESLNRTMLKNVQRDRGRGVKFARVPTGAETCTFCTMLASRGAVYATARNAGEQNHYHRGCDCKIVPSFGEDDLVEGYDPDAYYDSWQEFERIDKMQVDENGQPMSKLMRDELKRAYLNRHGMRGGESSGPHQDVAPMLDDIKWPSRRYGKKQAKHAKEWGLDPSRAKDRQKFEDVIRLIIEEPDEVVEASNWRDQPRSPYYYIRDNDVVVVNGDNEFVTILKGGVNNARVRSARNQVPGDGE